jgi:hypothetical protein
MGTAELLREYQIRIISQDAIYEDIQPSQCNENITGSDTYCASCWLYRFHVPSFMVVSSEWLLQNLRSRPGVAIGQRSEYFAGHSRDSLCTGCHRRRELEDAR